MIKIVSRMPKARDLGTQECLGGYVTKPKRQFEKLLSLSAYRHTQVSKLKYTAFRYSAASMRDQGKFNSASHAAQSCSGLFQRADGSKFVTFTSVYWSHAHVLKHLL